MAMMAKHAFTLKGPGGEKLVPAGAVGLEVGPTVLWGLVYDVEMVDGELRCDPASAKVFGAPRSQVNWRAVEPIDAATIAAATPHVPDRAMIDEAHADTAGEPTTVTAREAFLFRGPDGQQRIVPEGMAGRMVGDAIRWEGTYAVPRAYEGLALMPGVPMVTPGAMARIEPGPPGDPDAIDDLEIDRILDDEIDDGDDLAEDLLDAGRRIRDAAIRFADEIGDIIDGIDGDGREAE